MNEQMKRIWDQAVIESRDSELRERRTVFLDKLVKLIAEECVQLCQECINDGCLEAQEPMTKIKQHFGLE